jgi:AraC-like DNA-binding protein
MDPQFVLKTFYLDEKYYIDSKSNCYLIYVAQGNMVAHIGNNLRRLPEGFLMALPFESKVMFESLSPQTEIVSICFDEIPKTIHIDESAAVEGKHQHPHYRNVIDATDLLKSFFQHTVNLLRMGINNSEIRLMRMNELFMLLRMSLSVEEFSRFLKPLVSIRGNFKARVLRVVDNTMNVNQLAAAVGMTRSNFLLAFKAEFKEPPSTWLLRRRCKDVVTYFHTHDVPLKVAYQDLKFSTISNLAAFCKRFIGKTPREIRRDRSSSSI